MAAAVWTVCTNRCFLQKKWSPGAIRGFSFLLGLLRKFVFCSWFFVVMVWRFGVVKVVRRLAVISCPGIQALD